MTERSWLFTDGSSIPVGTMYCIGRNYAAHAIEMGAPVVDDPIVFIKPPSAYLPHTSDIVLPAFSQDVHHEVELVVVIGSDVDACDVSSAWNAVAGVGVGLDLTARDIQSVAKSKGHPWSLAKSWKGSAPVSPIIPTSDCGRGPWQLGLHVNDELRQHGSTADMERSVDQLISFVSGIFSLRRGDCIFTGTPQGVGPLHSGDVVRATLDGSSLLAMTCR
ncbi:MAG: fumarylacetoacetate hydrolase family protein [Candidatus Kapabacteria bacterium]|nr:fumarylacetoacetate hydrolase family protein [Candidatus Kapabacteria bacterium]